MDDIGDKLREITDGVKSGVQPFSYDQIMEGIMDSIMNDRWKGLRNPVRVMEQRDAWEQKEISAKQPAADSADAEQLVILQNGQKIVNTITTALSAALQGNKAEITITLVNGENGTKQYLTTNASGKMTTAMNMN